MRLQAVLFDLDDTLIDRAGAFSRYLEDLAACHPEAFPSSRRAEHLALLQALCPSALPQAPVAMDGSVPVPCKLPR